MQTIGLTGSIGTGKSTAAEYLAQKGVPVWDADRAVHELYKGPTALIIDATFPGTVKNGEVDRQRLTHYLMSFPQAIGELEAIIHPLVERDRARFIAQHRHRGTKHILLDIPLLFEKKLQHLMDVTLLITASPEVQRARVLARPRMSEAKFNTLRKRQMSQSEKQKEADYVIDNSGTLKAFHAALDAFLEAIE